MDNAHYNSTSLSLNLGLGSGVDCDRMNSAGPATVPSGYLKERLDDNKSCYSDNSSPHPPNDLPKAPSNKIFPSKSESQLHSQPHPREGKPYKCLKCSKTFANNSYLSQHTRIHLGIKPFCCEICQRKFTQLSHLQQHIRTHTGEKPYTCRHAGCTKAFSQLSNLQNHSRCHQTDKPFKCNSCYKRFSDEPSLLEHIPRHKESKHLKKHICQYCGVSYMHETYLIKHMRKHADRIEKRPPIGPGGPDSLNDGTAYWSTASGKMSSEQAAVGLHPQMNEPIITAASTPVAIKTQPSSSSAFTPIQSMGIGAHTHYSHHHHPHLNQHHQHHHIPDRGYLSYRFNSAKMTTVAAAGDHLSGLDNMSNTMNTSTKNAANFGSATQFHNQLISLQQIRNYQSPLVPEQFMQGIKDKKNSIL